ncbi:COG4748 Uncharacterized conserved protein [Sphingomonadaceae bacterium]
MEIAREILELQKKAIEHKDSLLTEEAAKTSLVLPFIHTLGYEIFNPKEVIPEFVADMGTKKGEKVDYAICINDSVNILIECKPANVKLDLNHASQLYRYFAVTKAKLAILTNGTVYQFYSDMDDTNIMDKDPFFILDLCQLKPIDIKEIKILEKFTKKNFDIDSIISEAKSLKMGGIIRAALEAEIAAPSDDFVTLIAKKIHDGRVTQAVKDSYSKLIVASFSNLIRDMVNDRLSSAINSTEEKSPDDIALEQIESDPEEIVTTEEELLGFRMVQAICAKMIDPNRVILRDSKSYAAILLDDNNRKTIARLRFNGKSVKYISLMSGKDETTQKIDDVAGIYKFQDQIISRINELIGD